MIQDDSNIAALCFQAEEMDARMLGALITGVRRAFPFVASDEVEGLVQRHGDHLFRLVHTAPFTVAVQALMLMYQLMSARNAISDRFYRAMYTVLATDGPTTSNRGPMFLALLFKVGAPAGLGWAGIPHKLIYWRAHGCRSSALVSTRPQQLQVIAEECAVHMLICYMG